MNLTAFLAAYRRDGWGRAAHDPAMMVALLLYAYAIGERSSRRIERRCQEDVAVRVITANHAPDHTTIARFRQRHEAALEELFGEVLALCAEAGIVGVEVIAIDGTKVHVNASQHATRDYEQIAREILRKLTASTPQKMSSSARSAVMSCRRSSRPRRVGVDGCAKPSVGWITSALRRLGRSRGRARNG